MKTLTTIIAIALLTNTAFAQDESLCLHPVAIRQPTKTNPLPAFLAIVRFDGGIVEITTESSSPETAKCKAFLQFGAKDGFQNYSLYYTVNKQQDGSITTIIEPIKTIYNFFKDLGIDPSFPVQDAPYYPTTPANPPPNVTCFAGQPLPGSPPGACKK